MDEVAANAALDCTYGDNHGASAPDTFYLALFRDDTFDEELTATAGIDRFPVDNDSAHFPDAAAATKTLSGALVSAASTDVWVHDATAWALMDDPVAGNRWDGDNCDAISNDEVGTVITVEDGAVSIGYDTD